MQKVNTNRTYTALLCLLLFSSCDKESSPAPKAVTPLPTSPQPRRLFVVLGSSTAEGVGASVYDSSWVGRCTTYLRSIKGNERDSIINLAKGGYTSYTIMPAGDANRNITKALSYKPYAILINMPTNDIANGISVDDQMKNFAAIAQLVKEQKAELWITTAQPRNLSEDGRKKLMELRDKITAAYGDHVIDFWNELANPNGTINSKYNLGDGIHVNNKGHRLLFSRVAEKKLFTN
jgi:lysophospholipase L1-like esterase